MPTIVAVVTVGPGGGTAPPPPAKPDATNTGYEPTGVTLTPYPATGGPAGPIVAGKLTITAANITLDSYDFACIVKIVAANVTIKRSRVRGPVGFNDTGSASFGLIDCLSTSCLNALIEDCTIRPDQPAYRWTGVLGWRYTERRCNISRCVDSGGGFNSASAGAVNNLVEFSWHHDHTYYAPDPNHPNDQPVAHSHCDGYQGQGGSGHTFRYCHIEGFTDTTVKSRDGSATSDVLRASSNPNSLGGYSAQYPKVTSNSCFQFTQPNPSVGSPVSDVTIDNCWLSGGAAAINFGAGLYSNVKITNNKFEASVGGYYILFPAAETSAVITGNVRVDTGVAVAIQRF